MNFHHLIVFMLVGFSSNRWANVAFSTSGNSFSLTKETKSFSVQTKVINTSSIAVTTSFYIKWHLTPKPAGSTCEQTTLDPNKSFFIASNQVNFLAGFQTSYQTANSNIYSLSHALTYALLIDQPVTSYCVWAYIDTGVEPNPANTLILGIYDPNQYGLPNLISRFNGSNPNSFPIQYYTTNFNGGVAASSVEQSLFLIKEPATGNCNALVNAFDFNSNDVYLVDSIQQPAIGAWRYDTPIRSFSSSYSAIRTTVHNATGFIPSNAWYCWGIATDVKKEIFETTRADNTQIMGGSFFLPPPPPPTPTPSPTPIPPPTPTPYPTGVEETQDEVMSLYPNPAVDQINIRLASSSFERTTLQIIDLTGRVVLETNLDSPLSQINVANLQSGIYVATLIQNKNRVQMRFQKI